MEIRIDAKAQLIHQLSNMNYLGITEKERKVIDQIYPLVIDEIDYCFSMIKSSYYHMGQDTLFNPYHVAQWTMFLYKMSNSIHRCYARYTELCDKIYSLSKCISSADLFYMVNLPSIWYFDHPQGSVLGKAEYSDFFSFSQGCTVGNNKGKYPRIGKHVSMMSGAKILGDCNVGHHVIFAANSYLIDRDIPSYSIVFGSSPNNTIKAITQDKFFELVGHIFT